jgi:GGDEF domain-containing protein
MDSDTGYSKLDELYRSPAEIIEMNFRRISNEQAGVPVFLGIIHSVRREIEELYIPLGNLLVGPTGVIEDEKKARHFGAAVSDAFLTKFQRYAIDSGLRRTMKGLMEKEQEHAQALDKIQKLQQQIVYDILLPQVLNVNSPFDFISFHVTESIRRLPKEEPQLNLLMLDINELDNIEKEFGQEASLAVLKAVASKLINTGRQYDHKFRIKAGEFYILFIDCPHDIADKKAKDLSRNIAETPIDLSIQILTDSVLRKFIEFEDAYKIFLSKRMHADNSLRVLDLIRSTLKSIRDYESETSYEHQINWILRQFEEVVKIFEKIPKNNESETLLQKVQNLINHLKKCLIVKHEGLNVSVNGGLADLNLKKVELKEDQKFYFSEKDVAGFVDDMKQAAAWRLGISKKKGSGVIVSSK